MNKMNSARKSRESAPETGPTGTINNHNPHEPFTKPRTMGSNTIPVAFAPGSSALQGSKRMQNKINRTTNGLGEATTQTSSKAKTSANRYNQAGKTKQG